MLTATATSDGLNIAGLSCLRGEALLFSALSFSLAAGQGLWLRGPNGSGKSSLLRILAGLLTAEAGSIDLGGVAIDRDLTSYRKGIAYLGHLDGLKPNETPREALAFAARLRGKPSDADALDRVGMQAQADNPVRYLSAGQRRRVALAAVLASDAKLWLLDEPTTALDETATALVYDALRRHLETGGMFVVATHDDPPMIDGTTSLVLGS